MLVIFDCDGVLVDSENLAAQVFSRCLREINIDISSQDCLRYFKGHTLDYCFTWLRERGVQLPENFADKLVLATKEKFATSLRAVSGVEKIIKELQERGILFCVASNGGHQKIQHSLVVCGLLKYFSHARFSSEDVFRGKPAPDLFLHAAREMGVAPALTTVIEDSLTGVQAALEAGMQTLLYQDQCGFSPPSVPIGVTTFKRMDDLRHLLFIDEA